MSTTTGLHRPAPRRLRLRAGRASAPAAPTAPGAAAPPPASLVLPGERHLANVRQLTFGGENAEAYWSFDGKLLIFQSTRDGAPCDQQYVMDADGSNVPAGLERRGPDHLRLLLPGRQPHPLLLDPRRRRRLPAPARHEPGLRVAALRLPDLHGPARRLRPPGPRAGARLLHRRGDHLEGRLDRLHLDPRRRPRHLQDAARRLGR